MGGALIAILREPSIRVSQALAPLGGRRYPDGRAGTNALAVWR